MRYVLDTNTVSALMKGEAQVLGRMRNLRRDEVSVPQPVLAEISYGIARLPHSRRRRSLAALLRSISEEIARCPWTDEVSARFGAIKAALERRGERLEDFDVAIAAHALAHHAVLVTANRAHMSRIAGLDVEDWAKRT